MNNIIEMNIMESDGIKANYVDFASTDLGVKAGRKELEVYFPRKKKTVKERLMAFFGK